MLADLITECRKSGASRGDVLAFEFEMGLFPAVLEEARGKGIDLEIGVKDPVTPISRLDSRKS